MSRVLLFFISIGILTGINSCYRILPSEGGAEAEFNPPRRVSAQDIAVPDGYEITAVTQGLTFPTDITFDADGVPYITEAGYSYGEVFIEPKLLKLEKDGSTTTVATGKRNGPWNGVEFHEGNFYVAVGGLLEGGLILKISKEGKIDTLVRDLPSLGDHQTNGPVIRDSFLYFAIGTATNSAVVGLDNLQYGWLKRFPDFHDIPCKDIKVKKKNFLTPNLLTEEKGDMALTGPFSSYNTAVEENELIEGRIPCSGAILRVPLEGGKPELVAWGFRNPYGMAVSPGGDLYLTENSYDVRGSRPVWGTGDVLWKVNKNKWYGWPDFAGGVPIHVFDVPGEKDPEFILTEHPNKPPHPIAEFGVHSSSNGITFSDSEDFGFSGHVFVAQFGDMASAAGKVMEPVGFKVVVVNPENGVVRTFAANKGTSVGPASWLNSNGLERPISVDFSPTGNELYIVDFGVLTYHKERGLKPFEKTGVIWKVTKR